MDPENLCQVASSCDLRLQFPAGRAAAEAEEKIHKLRAAESKTATDWSYLWLYNMIKHCLWYFMMIYLDLWYYVHIYGNLKDKTANFLDFEKKRVALLFPGDMFENNHL